MEKLILVFIDSESDSLETSFEWLSRIRILDIFSQILIHKNMITLKTYDAWLLPRLIHSFVSMHIVRSTLMTDEQNFIREFPIIKPNKVTEWKLDELTFYKH